MASYKLELNTSAPSYELELSRVGAQGVKGEPGSSLTTTWTRLVTDWVSQPTLVGSTTEGRVFQYTYSNTTLYRLVPNTSSLELDSFYTNFDNINLTGLVISRGMTINL